MHRRAGTQCAPSRRCGSPGIPQVFVKGELIGGADITEELNASGELRDKIDGALGAEHGQTVRTVALALD